MPGSGMNEFGSQASAKNRARWSMILAGLEAFSLGSDANSATDEVLEVTANIVHYFLVDSLGYCGGGGADDRKKLANSIVLFLAGLTNLTGLEVFVLHHLWKIRVPISTDIIQLADAYRALFLTACEVCDRLRDYSDCSILSKVIGLCQRTVLEDEDMDPWFAYHWMKNNMERLPPEPAINRGNFRLQQCSPSSSNPKLIGRKESTSRRLAKKVDCRALDTVAKARFRPVLVLKPSHPRLVVRWKAADDDSTWPLVQSCTPPRTLPVSSDPEVGLSSTFAAMALSTKLKLDPSPFPAPALHSVVGSEPNHSAMPMLSPPAPQTETLRLPQDSDAITSLTARQGLARPRQTVRGKKRHGPPGLKHMDSDGQTKDIYKRLAEQLMNHSSFPSEPHRLLPEDYDEEWSWLQKYQ